MSCSGGKHICKENKLRAVNGKPVCTFATLGSQCMHSHLLSDIFSFQSQPCQACSLMIWLIMNECGFSLFAR